MLYAFSYSRLKSLNRWVFTVYCLLFNSNQGFVYLLVHEYVFVCSIRWSSSSLGLVCAFIIIFQSREYLYLMEVLNVTPLVHSTYTSTYLLVRIGVICRNRVHSTYNIHTYVFDKNGRKIFRSRGHAVGIALVEIEFLFLIKITRLFIKCHVDCVGTYFQCFRRYDLMTFSVKRNSVNVTYTFIRQFTQLRLRLRLRNCVSKECRPMKLVLGTRVVTTDGVHRLRGKRFLWTLSYFDNESWNFDDFFDGKYSWGIVRSPLGTMFAIWFAKYNNIQYSFFIFERSTSLEYCRMAFVVRCSNRRRTHTRIYARHE